MYIVVGVLVLFLQTSQEPLKEAPVERVGVLLFSMEGAEFTGEEVSNDAAPVSTTETVTSLRLSGVAGVVGESWTGGNSSLTCYSLVDSQYHYPYSLILSTVSR